MQRHIFDVYCRRKYVWPILVMRFDMPAVHAGSDPVATPFIFYVSCLFGSLIPDWVGSASPLATVPPTWSTNQNSRGLRHNPDRPFCRPHPVQTHRYAGWFD